MKLPAFLVSATWLGLVASSPAIAIVDGFQSDTELPWMVAFIRKGDKPIVRRQFCGGALIAKDWVLTSAMCMRLIKKDNIDVVVGLDDLQELSDSPQSTYQVKEVKYYPDFKRDARYHGEDFVNNDESAANDHDIALVKIEPVEGVEPARLAKTAPPIESGYRVTGWGWSKEAKVYNTTNQNGEAIRLWDFASHEKLSSRQSLNVEVIDQQSCMQQLTGVASVAFIQNEIERSKSQLAAYVEFNKYLQGQENSSPLDYCQKSDRNRIELKECKRNVFHSMRLSKLLVSQHPTYAKLQGYAERGVTSNYYLSPRQSCIRRDAGSRKHSSSVSAVWFGDSGGPLFNPQTSEINGVISYGEFFGQERITVVTNVSQYSAWISETLNADQ